MKIGLSLLTLLALLNIGTFLVYYGASYTNQTSRVYDIFMNFCVATREIREINKRGGGGQNKLQGVSKNHEKINVPPRLF